jgi:methylated-DNA-[protein]-cysteine S-methyltransferase
MRRPSRPLPSPGAVTQALFATPFGECGLAWTARGLAWIQLPDRTPAATRARMAAGLTDHPSSTEADPPSWVADIIARLTGYFEGRALDLAGIPLDMERVSPFFRRVYEEARAIPRGEVRTYAELAAAAGSPTAMRAVGQAMARNRWPVVVPCHRVVGSAGKPGGFSAPGGLDTKARLLALEGAPCILGGPRLKTGTAAS